MRVWLLKYEYVHLVSIHLYPDDIYMNLNLHKLLKSTEREHKVNICFRYNNVGALNLAITALFTGYLGERAQYSIRSFQVKCMLIETSKDHRGQVFVTFDEAFN